jgi:hypothetical protein
LTVRRVARSMGGALALLLIAAAAQADRVVLVVRPGARDALSQRLERELRTEGFEVSVVESDTPADPEALALAATSAGGVAAVTAERMPHSWSADLWMTDRASGRVSRRRLQGFDSSDPQVLALRAVELLRASLHELSETPVPPEPTPTPLAQAIAIPPDLRPPSRPPSPAPSRHQIGIAIAGAVLTAPGGFPPTVAPATLVSWRVSGPWVAEFLAVLPTSATLVSAAGSASLDQTLLLARARLRIGPEAAMLTGHATLGGGAYLLSGKGFATAPYASTTASIVGAAGGLGGGARLALVPPLALVVDVTAAVVAPRPVVAFADDAVAHTGRPLVVTALALEAAW